MNIKTQYSSFPTIQFAVTFLVALALCFVSQNASADAAALADKAGCMACHNVDSRKVGPAFKDISAKYKGQDVQQTLVDKIKTGGRGTWGVLPMPPNAGKMSDEEFKEVVNWITSL